MSDDPTPIELAHKAEVARAARRSFFADLGAARRRLSPTNLRDEAVDKIAETVEDAAATGVELAKRHKGKLSLIAGIGALVAARKPLLRLAGRARARLGNKDTDDEA